MAWMSSRDASAACTLPMIASSAVRWASCERSVAAALLPAAWRLGAARVAGRRFGTAFGAGLFVAVRRFGAAFEEDSFGGARRFRVPGMGRSNSSEWGRP